VERAGEHDIARMVELMHHFYAESGHALDPAWAEASFRQLFGNESRGRAWIAWRGTEPIGYVVLTLRHSMEFGGPAGFIDDLFVHSRARRNGVGSALLAVLFDACRDLGVTAVHVEAGSGNAASGGLYRKFGLLAPTDDRQLLTARLAEP
jgi:GNAT superfamily N-acetyltransferase